MVCTTTVTTATVVGSKTMRAGGNCFCLRMQWYCVADDIFLCQNCDSSVHSAKPLARRHDRVRLQTNSISKSDKLVPRWHHGFKRKVRTPRPSMFKIRGPVSSLVPEMETSPDDGGAEEEQLLYCVPIFDPVIAEICNSNSETKLIVSSITNPNISNSSTITTSNEFLAGLLQSHAELAGFAADMESLLGRGLDNDSFPMEELNLIDTKYSTSSHEKIEQVKEESDNVEEDAKLYEEVDLSRETLEINFASRSGDEEQEETIMVSAEAIENTNDRKKIGLRLDYEAIAREWSVSGSLSPWMNGERPQFGPDDCWLDYMGMWGVEMQGLVQGEMGAGHFDEGREARVSRYREKRRTRLFSKKIRYEVRKLNAEKRPRMKGRFVKRASFTTAASSATTFKY